MVCVCAHPNLPENAPWDSCSDECGVCAWHHAECYVHHHMQIVLITPEDDSSFSLPCNREEVEKCAVNCFKLYPEIGGGAGIWIWFWIQGPCHWAHCRLKIDFFLFKVGFAAYVLIFIVSVLEGELFSKFWGCLTTMPKWKW